MDLIESMHNASTGYIREVYRVRSNHSSNLLFHTTTAWLTDAEYGLDGHDAILRNVSIQRIENGSELYE